MRHPIEAAIIALTSLYLACALALFLLGFAPDSVYRPLRSGELIIEEPITTHSIYSASSASYVPPVDSVATTYAIVPSKLLIPKIEIETKVQHVGKTSQGNMAIPSNHNDVGWYEHGVKPGEKGSAAFAGHLDSPWFSAGVFRRLNELVVGDEITTVDVNGKTLTFIVNEVAIYDEQSAPLDYIFGRDDAPRIVLITCDGKWNQTIRRYDKRLVVFAELKGSVDR